VKHHQRLDHGRLAEVLHERGIANVDAIRELLQQSREGGMPFCEALVTTNLVPDWDLSRIVCETFSLPFLPVDMVEPNPKLKTELDMKLFRAHQLVPLDRFGQVLTVIMPALVPADVLAMLSAASDFVILPVVGTVETNRRWILENLGAGKAAEIEGGWGNLFDAADAAVNAALGGDVASPTAEESFFAPPSAAGAPAGLSGLAMDDLPVEDLQFELPEVVAQEDDALDLGVLGSLGDLPGGDLDASPLAVDDDDEEPSAPRRAGTSSLGAFELPPMPEFGAGRQAG
jgi:hypothetical protein